MSKIAFFPNSALPLLKSKSLFSSKPVTFLVNLSLDLAEASPRCVQNRCEIANVARPAFARTLILFWQHRMLQREWLIDVKSLFEKSDAGSLAWQIDGCKDADQRHILEYIENRERRRRPVAAPMRCRRSFQACSEPDQERKPLITRMPRIRGEGCNEVVRDATAQAGAELWGLCACVYAMKPIYIIRVIRLESLPRARRGGPRPCFWPDERDR